MPIYDISRTLNLRTPVWPGDPPFQKSAVARHEAGDGYALSTLSMSAHAGTHLDLPAHFCATGATAEAVPPERFILRALLLKVPPGSPLGVDLLASLPAGIKAVLVQTAPCADSLLESHPSQPYQGLTRDAVTWLLEHQILLVGVDQLSVDDPTGDSFEAHERLCRAGVIVLEGAALSHVPAGEYTLIALPLKIEGGEASPTRALLITPPLAVY